MESLQSTNYYVHFQNNAYESLQNYLNENFHSKIFILVDINTEKHCLPQLLKHLKTESKIETIRIEAGENHKNIATCVDLWEQLSDLGADRKSLMINLGGGVITDMGAFVASTFKRGIRFINIPTTLLSMVDASVGGKTGVDLGALKNQIGLFSNPEMVLIDTQFLDTVPAREMRSGLAEVIKYGFTFDQSIWNKIKSTTNIDAEVFNDLVHRSIAIKNDVVLKDPKEDNLRKTLNFGHTIGHAIESYFLESDNKNDLTHGESIAIGMIIELYYSTKLFNFPMDKVEELKLFVNDYYGKTKILKSDFQPIVDLMQFDKKNVNGKVNFVLLNTMEKCEIDVQVNDDLIIAGIEYYLS